MQMNARIAVAAFGWLVGPMERKDVEVAGRSQRSAVLIQRCRYLEESGCVGQCVNVCKIPTETFFNTEFGQPLYMKPNYEDFSCEVRAKLWWKQQRQCVKARTEAETT
jgi:hypothetical protein